MNIKRGFRLTFYKAKPSNFDFIDVLLKLILTFGAIF